MNLELEIAKKEEKLKQVQDEALIKKVNEVINPTLFDISNSQKEVLKHLNTRLDGQGEAIKELNKKLDLIINTLQARNE